MILKLFKSLLKDTILDMMPFNSDLNNIVYQYYYCIHMIDKVEVIDDQNMAIVSNCLLCPTSLVYDSSCKYKTKNKHLF